jgi:hypothetical protein
MNQDERLRKKILRYLSGEMPSIEARAFEEEMLDDPFLSDAVEGLQQEASLPRLQAELMGIDLALNNKGGRKSRLPYYSIAAVFLLVIGTALVIWLRIQETKEVSRLSSESMVPAEEEGTVTTEAMPEISQKTITREPFAPPSGSVEDKPRNNIAMTQEAPAEARSESANLNMMQDHADSYGGNMEEPAFQAGAAPGKMEDLLVNPDVADQVLAWAESLQESPSPKSSGRIQESSVSEKEPKMQTESGVRAQVAGSATSGHYERRIISTLIREGKWKEAEQAISRYEKTWPDDKSVYILKSGLELKRGNKAKGVQYLKSLKNTPYEKEAKEFEKKIGG